MIGATVLRAAGQRQEFLGGALERDWNRKIPGLERQTSWRWHCAPLEEWDGTNPRDRR
jgi:hypothetical protein